MSEPHTCMEPAMVKNRIDFFEYEQKCMKKKAWPTCRRKLAVNVGKGTGVFAKPEGSLTQHCMPPGTSLDKSAIESEFCRGQSWLHVLSHV